MLLNSAFYAYAHRAYIGHLTIYKTLKVPTPAAHYTLL